MFPKHLSIRDFTYILPEEKIARFPLPERDHSKLLVYRNGYINEDKYYNIAEFLPENSLLLFNNTKVVQARIFFQKPTGAIIEIFALEPHDNYNGLTAAMHEKEKVLFKCLIGGAGKWKHGQVLQKQIEFSGTTISLKARITERLPDSFIIEFSWQPGHHSFSEILQFFGEMPIPPYLKRDTDVSDLERYQTVYASEEGSVAAPTAGLHFTDRIFESLQKKGIKQAFVTLHVGAGTFMPVKADTMEGHHMHAEYIEAAYSLIQSLVHQATYKIAVGTTSVRSIESLYWMGVKCFYKPDISLQELEIKQWEVYEDLEQKAIAVEEALMALLRWMKSRSMITLIIKTQILIAPSYKLKIINGLITNFHQPNSTLLLLVAALIGDDWKKVYEYALNNNFRFLSYGDGCLFLL